jgi:hypothetical protein
VLNPNYGHGDRAQSDRSESAALCTKDMPFAVDMGTIKFPDEDVAVEIEQHPTSPELPFSVQRTDR